MLFNTTVTSQMRAAKKAIMFHEKQIVLDETNWLSLFPYEQNKNRSGTKCLKPHHPLSTDPLGGPAPYIYIYIYIDPRGALFGAPVLCFYTACLVDQSVIEHSTLDLALGTSREFAIR